MFSIARQLLLKWLVLTTQYSWQKQQQEMPDANNALHSSKQLVQRISQSV